MSATVSQPQHMQALAMANKAKKARGELKRRVRDGKLPVAAVIRLAPAELRSNRPGSCVTASEVLTWQTGWGRARAEKFLRQHDVSTTIPLHSLSPVTRKRLAVALGA